MDLTPPLLALAIFAALDTEGALDALDPALNSATILASSHGRTASNAAVEVDEESSSDFLGDMYTAPTLIKTMAVHATKQNNTFFHLSEGERWWVLATAIEELLVDDDDDDDDDGKDGLSKNTSML